VTRRDGLEHADPMLVDPYGELGGVESYEMADPDEGDPALGDQSTDVTGRDVERRGDRLGVDENGQPRPTTDGGRPDCSLAVNPGSLRT
jgi:hypothetical protein